MQNVVHWSELPASTVEEAMDFLFHVSSALKTQAVASPFFDLPEHGALKAQLSEMADELHGMQTDISCS
nr:hypothetical protein [Oceanococcus sp. HetDA_MAG_MS8]